MKRKALSLVALSLLVSLPLASCNGHTSESTSHHESTSEITATTSQTPEKVTIEVKGNGEGGEVYFAQGDYKIGNKVHLKVKINKGYSLAYIKVNNEKIRPVANKYYFEITTFKNVIEVLFEKNQVIMSDFKFEIDDATKSATIVKYSPDSRIVPYPFVVPETVTFDDVTYKITGIKKLAFSSSNVEHIVISKNIENIELETFATVHGLTTIEVVKDNPVYASYDNCLYSKDLKTLIAAPTEYLNKTMTIKDNTTTIGASAFVNNRLIEKIILPNSVTTLNDQCFMEMSSLKEIVLSPKIIKIPCRTFANDNNLHEIVIPEGIEEIGDYAFYFCAELTSVSLPTSLKVIGKEAFYRCQKLSDIALNEGLTKIDKSAFGSCISIENMVMPSTLKYLGEATFEACSGLNKVSLNEGLEYIGGAAFILTPFLKDIVIPSSVKTISYNPLIGAGESKLILADGNTNFKVVDGVLYSSDLSTLICVPYSFKPEGLKFTIPSSVTTLGYNCFAMNRYLKEVRIPTSVTSMNCSFQEILPNETTRLYEMELFYEGSMAQFEEIDHGLYIWNYLANFKNNVLTCNDGQIQLEPQTQKA